MTEQATDFQPWDQTVEQRAGEPLFINGEKFEQDGTIESQGQLGMAYWFRRGSVAITGVRSYDHPDYNRMIRWELTVTAGFEANGTPKFRTGYALMATKFL